MGMNKLTSLTILSLLLISSVFAQDLSSRPDLAGVTTPDHTFGYFIKTAIENTKLALTFGDSDTVLRSQIAEDKSIEEEKLTLLNRTDLLPNVEVKRQKLMDDVNKANVTNPTAQANIKSHLANALAVLTRVQAKLQAKGIQAQGLATAINNIQQNIARINQTRSTLSQPCNTGYGCRP